MAAGHRPPTFATRLSTSEMADILLSTVNGPTYANAQDFRVMGVHQNGGAPFLLAMGRTPTQAENYARAHRRHLFKEYGVFIPVHWLEQYVGWTWKAMWT